MRMTINPDDFLRAKLVKPGWYILFLKEMVDEINSKKDGFNVVTDVEIAEQDSEFYGVPVKHWFSEKGISMPGGAISLILAFEPKINQSSMQEVDINQYKGKYIWGKVDTDRGQDGMQPPRNVIKDWAPLPNAGPNGEKARKFVELNQGGSAAAGTVPTFGG